MKRLTHLIWLFSFLCAILNAADVNVDDVNTKGLCRKIPMSLMDRVLPTSIINVGESTIPDLGELKFTILNETRTANGGHAQSYGCESSPFDYFHSNLRFKTMAGKEIGRGKIKLETMVLKASTATFDGIKVRIKPIELIHKSDINIYEQEITHLMGLAHPNLRKIYAYGVVKNRCVSIEEAFPFNLNSWLRSQPSPQRVKQFTPFILEDILSGLIFLHDHGEIHKRLKTENILLAFDSIPGALRGDEGHYFKSVITGHGLVKLRTGATSRGVFKQSLETVRWRSPESLVRYPILKPSTDTYSFGVIWWNLETQKLIPYEEIESAIDAIERGQKLVLPEKTSDDIRKVMHACWNQNESLRPNARQLMTALYKIFPQLYEERFEIALSELNNQSSDYYDLPIMQSASNFFAVVENFEEGGPLENVYKNLVTTISTMTFTLLINKYKKISSISENNDNTIFLSGNILESIEDIIAYKKDVAKQEIHFTEREEQLADEKRLFATKETFLEEQRNLLEDEKAFFKLKGFNNMTDQQKQEKLLLNKKQHAEDTAILAQEKEQYPSKIKTLSNEKEEHLKTREQDLKKKLARLMHKLYTEGPFEREHTLINLWFVKVLAYLFDYKLFFTREALLYGSTIDEFVNDSASISLERFRSRW